MKHEAERRTHALLLGGGEGLLLVLRVLLLRVRVECVHVLGEDLACERRVGVHTGWWEQTADATTAVVALAAGRNDFAPGLQGSLQ